MSWINGLGDVVATATPPVVQGLTPADFAELMKAYNAGSGETMAQLLDNKVTGTMPLSTVLIGGALVGLAVILFALHGKGS